MSRGPAEIVGCDQIRGKARICEGFQRDFGDRRTGVTRRESMNDTLLSKITGLAVAIKVGVDEVRI